MKELAIIGSSNSFIKNGYGQRLKAQYGDNCDIYALGATGMGWMIHALLMNKILDEYKYVLIQFGPRDSRRTETGGQSPYSTIAYLVFILDFISKSSTTPIFLCASYTGADRFESFQYIINAIASIYGVYVINLQALLSNMDCKSITFDGAHYSDANVSFILDQVNIALSPPKKNAMKITACILISFTPAMRVIWRWPNSEQAYYAAKHI